jgi:hydrogenase maturation protease
VSRLVVAVAGNRLRGDDAAGPLVADAVRAAGIPVRVVEAATNPLTLLDAWCPEDTVFLVDAALSGAPPGTIHEFTPHDAALFPEPPGGSTHGFGLASVVELARVLGHLPRTLVILGIAGAGFDLGSPPHPAVRRAAAIVADRIAAAADAASRTRS